MMPKPRCILIEPIDYESLAAAYVAARWKWSDGFPSSEVLERRIVEGKADVESRPGPRNCLNSGGIHIEWFDGKVVVSIDQKLGDHHKPKTPTNQPLSDMDSLA
jgi:hypothetical protein